ncbi:hypothetical protein ACFZA1_30840 [Streptomyces filipinensis]|uniref:hypothetical protein n=1 Tax=Streptomyces filipinensis TaxID=66887 RepID=UPI0036E71807
MPDAYEVMLDAELSKAFDVWSSYLNAHTGEDPEARARLRSTLESARAAAADDPVSARGLVADMYDDAREAGLPWAPVSPSACEADQQARDYAKDELRQVLPLHVREELDSIALHLRVTGRRLQNAPDLDVAARQDVLYLAARAWMALDLAHPAAARRELERLAAIARRRGVEP